MIRKYFCIISEKIEYEMLTKEIGEMFIQMEEQNVLSDTAVYNIYGYSDPYLSVYV